MDDINYRRVTNLPKRRCEDCGATCCQDQDKIYRCVVCDHERFEVCLDCGQLVGWCECEPATKAVAKSTARRVGANGKTATRKKAARPRATAAKARKK